MLRAECVSAYVEWAPLGRLGSSGLLPACAFLLGQTHHRMAACGALRKLSGRKQLKEVCGSLLHALLIFWDFSCPACSDCHAHMPSPAAMVCAPGRHPCTLRLTAAVPMRRMIRRCTRL